MLRQVKASIDESLCRLNAGNYSLAALLKPLDRTDNQLYSPRPELLGFHALRQILRRLLMSVNHIIGGLHLNRYDLHSPSIACFYTGSFQLLHGYLAMRGRVILDAPPDAPGRPGANAMVKLTRDNEWVIERRSQSHTKRWLELKQVWAPREIQVPPYFERPFRYFFEGRLKEGIDAEEATDRLRSAMRCGREVEDMTPALDDNMDEFLRRIAQTRHTALYESRGADPALVEALINGDTCRAEGLNRQASEMGLFTASFLKDVAQKVRRAAETIEMREDARRHLFASVYLPPFDEAKLEECPKESIRQDLTSLQQWLRPGSEKGDDGTVKL